MEHLDAIHPIGVAAIPNSSISSGRAASVTRTADVVNGHLAKMSDAVLAHRMGDRP
jgi:hypothetical protein